MAEHCMVLGDSEVVRIHPTLGDVDVRHGILRVLSNASVVVVVVARVDRDQMDMLPSCHRVEELGLRDHSTRRDAVEILRVGGVHQTTEEEVAVRLPLPEA